MTVFAARAIGDAEKDAEVSIKLKASVALPGFETKHSAKAVAAYPGVNCVFVDAATCVEIKILRRPPRHRRDACSIAWWCRFLTARPSQHGRSIAEKCLVKNCRVHPTH